MQNVEVDSIIRLRISVVSIGVWTELFSILQFAYVQYLEALEVTFSILESSILDNE